MTGKLQKHRMRETVISAREAEAVSGHKQRRRRESRSRGWMRYWFQKGIQADPPGGLLPGLARTLAARHRTS
jgi:hypothetical protein